MQNKNILVIGFFIFLVGLVFVSAQVLNPNPVVFGVDSTGFNCNNFAYINPINLSETDSGVDFTTPGKVSGVFYDLNNPNIPPFCGTYSDTCTTNNYLIEIVWGGSSYLGPTIAPGSLPGLAGAVEVDCSTLGAGWVCNQPYTGIGYCGPPLNDLVPLSVAVNSPSPNPVLDVVISNNGAPGAVTASPFSVTVTIFPLTGGGFFQSSAVVPAGFSSGTTSTTQVSFSSIPSGNYIANMNVDSTNIIQESNEFNNLINGIPLNL
jgi:hypothetical protein